MFIISAMTRITSKISALSKFKTNLEFFPGSGGLTAGAGAPGEGGPIGKEPAGEETIGGGTGPGGADGITGGGTGRGASEGTNWGDSLEAPGKTSFGTSLLCSAI